MAKSFTVQAFFARFPTDDACLDHLMALRFGATVDCPKCRKNGKFSRITKMPAYQCAWCGHHIHPMVGTPFEKSRTSLQKWFYAMYLFTTSRHGVPAKELQRQLGVTYKTAWRIGHEIRKYMGHVDGDDGLSGEVEMDETYIGGRDKVRGRPGINSKKVAVFGMVERNGDLITKVVPDTTRGTLMPIVAGNVAAGTTVHTDENRVYRALTANGYTHRHVNHSAERWVNGTSHTNSIENFWSRLKNSIRGTHIHVSRKHLQKYLAEFEYRYNMRKATPTQMFDRLVEGF